LRYAFHKIVGTGQHFRKNDARLDGERTKEGERHRRKVSPQREKKMSSPKTFHAEKKASLETFPHSAGKKKRRWKPSRTLREKKSVAGNLPALCGKKKASLETFPHSAGRKKSSLETFPQSAGRKKRRWKPSRRVREKKASLETFPQSAGKEMPSPLQLQIKNSELRLCRRKEKHGAAAMRQAVKYMAGWTAAIALREEVANRCMLQMLKDANAVNDTFKRQYKTVG
jgi:hypothetical protein